MAGGGGRSILGGGCGGAGGSPPTASGRGPIARASSASVTLLCATARALSRASATLDASVGAALARGGATATPRFGGGALPLPRALTTLSLSLRSRAAPVDDGLSKRSGRRCAPS